jgi:hypothetical protein
MFARAVIFLTLLFSAGVALAGWQSGPLGIAASFNRPHGTVPQAAPRITPASLSRGTDTIEPAKAKHMPRPEVVTLIRKGNKLMREGDITGARAAYREAVAFGDPAAALVMGRSYDPIYFARIVERNAEPDPAKALEWYGLAREEGAVQTAMVRIKDLKRFMSK